MRPLTTYRLYFSLVACTMFLFSHLVPDYREIRYSQPATIPFDWDKLQADTVAYQDTFSNNILFQVRTLEGIPIFYGQDIVTSVCFDNKCRPLDLTVYWNITGRYLGFRLPEKEFLSRYDHQSFSPEDYSRLNTLLADAHLPLGNISFEDLIQRSAIQKDSLDGVSGATSKDVLAYVVEGAAYTTYTMWNIVYGPTRSLVRRLTEEEMTPELLALILQSPSSEDKIWGLGKITGSEELDPRIEGALLETIGSEEFFVGYTAVHVLKARHLGSESLQTGLLSKYQTVTHSLKKQILEKLMEAPTISGEVISRSRDLLPTLNGQQLGYFLELYRHHHIEDITTCRALTALLIKDNSFISNKAYEYLKDVEINDATIIRALREYGEKGKKE